MRGVGKERNRQIYDAISGTKHEKYLLIHVAIMHVRNCRYQNPLTALGVAPFLLTLDKLNLGASFNFYRVRSI